MIIILTVLIIGFVFIMALLTGYISNPGYSSGDSSADFLLFIFGVLLINSIIQSNLSFILIPIFLVWLVLLFTIISDKLSDGIRKYSIKETENQKEDTIPYKYD